MCRSVKLGSTWVRRQHQSSWREQTKTDLEVPSPDSLTSVSANNLGPAEIEAPDSSVQTGRQCPQRPIKRPSCVRAVLENRRTFRMQQDAQMKKPWNWQVGKTHDHPFTGRNQASPFGVTDHGIKTTCPLVGFFGTV